MTTLVIDLMMSQSDSPLPTSTTTTTLIITTTTTFPPPPPPQSTSDLMLLKCIGELEQHMVDLIQENLALEERLEKHGTQLYKLENLNIPHKVSQAVDEIMFEEKSYEAHEDHNDLYKALQKSLEQDYSNQLLADQEEARRMKRKRHFEGQAYEVVKAFYPDVIHLQFQMDECHKMLTDQVDWTNPEGDHVRVDVNRPLPLGSPPGHVTIQTQFFFNKDFGYLRYGSKGSSPALSISKMKAASYPDFGIELLVPEQMWIDDVCTYDIIDFQEHTIAEKDFKNLYPSDFEDLNLLLLQGHLDHLPGSDKQMLSIPVKLWTRNLVIRQQDKDFQLGIESYQTQLNLTKPGWDATGYEFKHDYTIIESPLAVVFPVDNNDQKIIRFNEIYKFSDGTLTRILEALDYRVKEFKVKRLNPGMNTRFWTQKDVTRSKEFIAAIERRLKTRRIYQNLECFVGGRVRDIDYKLLQRTE
ncbi:hypothetical protein Tco_0797709 [Tanacetum coccineum]